MERNAPTSQLVAEAVLWRGPREMTVHNQWANGNLSHRDQSTWVRLLQRFGRFLSLLDEGAVQRAMEASSRRRLGLLGMPMYRLIWNG